MRLYCGPLAKGENRVSLSIAVFSTAVERSAAVRRGAMPTRPFTAQELEDAELAMMLAHLKRRIEVQESRRPRSRRGVRRPQVGS